MEIEGEKERVREGLGDKVREKEKERWRVRR